MELFEREIYKRYMTLIEAAGCAQEPGFAKVPCFAKSPRSTKEPRAVRLAEIMDDYDAFCFDGYGTLYNRGAFVYPGSREMFDALRKAGKQLRLVTNAASDVVDVLAADAAKRGFNFSASETISSGSLLGDLAANLRAGICFGNPSQKVAPRTLKEVFYIGRETGLHVLNANGIDAVENPVEPIVAISSAKDTPETYAHAVEILRRPGAVLLVLNSDAWAPKTDGTREPVSGALCERLRRDSVCDANDGMGCETYYLGKPFPEIWTAVRKTLPASLFDGKEPRVLMIGDTLGTDIYGGKIAGFDSALLIGRNEPAAELKGDQEYLGIVPDFYIL